MIEITKGKKAPRDGILLTKKEWANIQLEKQILDEVEQFLQE